MIRFSSAEMIDLFPGSPTEAAGAECPDCGASETEPCEPDCGRTAVLEMSRLPTREVPLSVLPDEAADTQHRRDIQRFVLKLEPR